MSANDTTTEKIMLAHGAGGALMQDLLGSVIIKGITNRSAGSIGLDQMDDGATITLGNKLDDGELVVTTDSHAIKPLFFPKSDIGRLAIAGTVNDLAMMGARPIALTNAMIIEEGFSIVDLKQIMRSIDAATTETDVPIITGDTKVMEQGALDKLVVNTTGIGIATNGTITDQVLKIGDKIIITGTIGDHGTALLAFREGFSFTTELVSDVAPLWKMIEPALAIGGITAMKDPTRGGVAGALNEMASKSNTGIRISEEMIPVKEAVHTASGMLGIDPLEVANEGKAIIGVTPDRADEVLDTIRASRYGRDAEVVGEVVAEYTGKVVLETTIGGKRYVEAPVADPVPRVC
ncbi:MAG: hydrogenase expression/formation protein HypE [Methanosarcinales archaeon]|nr:MAG: hydrogenase expression/formation protein HypE [Methanosarcinales archaeon]